MLGLGFDPVLGVVPVDVPDPVSTPLDPPGFVLLPGSGFFPVPTLPPVPLFESLPLPFPEVSFTVGIVVELGLFVEFGFLPFFVPPGDTGTVPGLV